MNIGELKTTSRSSTLALHTRRKLVSTMFLPKFDHHSWALYLNIGVVSPKAKVLGTRKTAAETAVVPPASAIDTGTIKRTLQIVVAVWCREIHSVESAMRICAPVEPFDSVAGKTTQHTSNSAVIHHNVTWPDNRMVSESVVGSRWMSYCYFAKSKF